MVKMNLYPECRMYHSNPLMISDNVNNNARQIQELRRDLPNVLKSSMSNEINSLKASVNEIMNGLTGSKQELTNVVKEQSSWGFWSIFSVFQMIIIIVLAGMLYRRMSESEKKYY